MWWCGHFPGRKLKDRARIVPAGDLTLRWATFAEAADQAGLSRRCGGIHFEQGDLDGRHAGREVANIAWAKAQS